MPTILLAHLQITPVSATQAKVTVTSRVRFSPLELHLMQFGLKFRLDARLFGQDIAFDDALITPGPSKIYPDPTPTAMESHTWTTTVPKAFLNEDVGLDEIYARVFLRNLANGATVNKKSNVEVEAF